MKHEFKKVVATTEEVVAQRLADIVQHPQEHAHDQARLRECCSIDGEIRAALAAAHWEHVT